VVLFSSLPREKNAEVAKRQVVKVTLTTFSIWLPIRNPIKLAQITTWLQRNSLSPASHSLIAVRFHFLQAFLWTLDAQVSRRLP
jgi:hypothetical protein